MLNRVLKKKITISCLAFALMIQSGGCGQKTGENAGTANDHSIRHAEETGMEGNSEMGTAEEYGESDIPLPDGAADILAVREAGGIVWMVTGQDVYSSLDQGETWVHADAETAAVPAGCLAAAISRNSKL